jgi:hypothetical protein
MVGHGTSTYDEREAIAAILRVLVRSSKYSPNTRANEKGIEKS